MASGYQPIYAEQDKVLPNDSINIFRKNSTTTDETVILENTNNANRYAGILFIVENSGYSAVYAVSYKLLSDSSVLTDITKLAGTTHNVTISNSGNISVPLFAWSWATLIRTK